jgi:hypothetical protein
VASNAPKVFVPSSFHDLLALAQGIQVGYLVGAMLVSGLQP